MEVSKLTPSKMFKKTVRYDVPEFQRRYVWGLERQWEPFWEDVTEVAADLGAISETYRHLEDRLGPDSETFLY